MNAPTLCPRCKNVVGADDDVCAVCGLRRGSASARATSGLQALSGRVTATGFFLGLIGVAFAAMVVMQGGVQLSLFTGFDWGVYLRSGMLYPPLIRLADEWWRFVTAMLIHGGIGHLAMNGWVLWQLGPICANYYDQRRVTIFFVIGGLVGTLMSFAFGGRPSLGASGAVLAVATAVVVKARLSGGAMDRYLYAKLSGWIVFIFIFGILGRHLIDAWGHFGGMVGGAVLGYLLRNEHGWRARVHMALFVVSVAILALGIGFALWAAFNPERMEIYRTLGEQLDRLTGRR